MGKNLFDAFHIGLKQGEALSSLLFNASLECAIRTLQGNREGLELSVIHQLLVNGDYDNIIDENTNTVRKAHKPPQRLVGRCV